ncbi:hypothetical protein RND81_06G182500 [Saponaria officinalis]|uniref:At1g61320/AtMIF1 LRR domain-containing protein n=1 Tax=Saponaria officinalis TaxID=3572 RepID=A0AAW1K7T0_SAPOF
MERQSRKCLGRSKKVKGGDPFTRLPDEVITSHILSRFTLEEGARYCILSRRWKKLWASTIGSKLTFAPELLRIDQRLKMDARGKRFDFSFLGLGKRFDFSRFSQAISRLRPMETVNSRIKRLRPSFERWISNVLQSYSMPELDELSVRFPFDSSNGDSIDTWVECALKKGITRLELDLFSWGELDVFWWREEPTPQYTFPKLEKLQGMLPNCVGLNLRDVRLKYVPVSADVIEFMVAHFPIERLSIERSPIHRLNIGGESVKLKCLELIKSAKYLRISASSLTSLKFSGRERRLLLEHVPRLSELSVDTEFCTTFLPSGLQHGGYISGLKRLELAMSEEVVSSSINYPLEFAATLNLEELQVEICGREDSCLLWPVVLLKAAPFLRKFSVKLSMSCIPEWKISGGLRNESTIQRLSRQTLVRNAAKQVLYHEYLKTVEVHNFIKEPNQSELVQHLLPILSLEQIVISLHSASPRKAEVIATWLPPTSIAKLIIL